MSGEVFCFLKDSRGWKVSKVGFSESLLILPNHCFLSSSSTAVFQQVFKKHAHSSMQRTQGGKSKGKRRILILKSDAAASLYTQS